VFTERLRDLVAEPNPLFSVSVRLDAALPPAIDDARVLHAANVGRQLFSQNFRKFCHHF